MSFELCPKPAMELIQLFCGHPLPPTVDRHCRDSYQEIANKIKNRLRERSPELREYLVQTADIDSCSVQKIHKLIAQVLQLKGETIDEKFDRLKCNMHECLCSFYDALPAEVQAILAVDFEGAETIDEQAERIQAAFDRDSLDLSGVTKLDLQNQNLAAIPSVIARFTNLTVLDLDHNRLTDLPNLSGLDNLQTLFLRYNRFTEVPDLSGLNNLQFIDLRNNHIPGIYDLSGLVCAVIGGIVVLVTVAAVYFWPDE